ncbi:hypothetical protein F5141DRAFT_475019 [Pisolithus sp. B1]|nr:hypothetical protein F5141DRAFT_475019 [Pisolithus sp. B1]
MALLSSLALWSPYWLALPDKSRLSAPQSSRLRCVDALLSPCRKPLQLLLSSPLVLPHVRGGGGSDDYSLWHWEEFKKSLFQIVEAEVRRLR